MAGTTWDDLGRVSPLAASAGEPRHRAIVRVTHWMTALCFLALLVSGMEIVISHPRFYWGENGNVLTPALFSFHIPSSRATVPTGYGYLLPDQNGWSRYLHFEAAWVLVLTARCMSSGAPRAAISAKTCCPMRTFVRCRRCRAPWRGTFASRGQP